MNRIKIPQAGKQRRSIAAGEQQRRPGHGRQAGRLGVEPPDRSQYRLLDACADRFRRGGAESNALGAFRVFPNAGSSLTQSLPHQLFAGHDLATKMVAVRIQQVQCDRRPAVDNAAGAGIQR